MNTSYIDALIQKYPVILPQRNNIIAVYKLLEKCYENGHRLFIAGNGGSAADALHITGELMKSFIKKRPIEKETKVAFYKLYDKKEADYIISKLQGCLPALALLNNTSLETAYINDVEADMVFAQQLFGYAEKGDILLAISTSGDAKNILYAAKTMKAIGGYIVGLTGKDGGDLAALCDTCIKVDKSLVYEIQELHQPIYHTLCLMLEDHFF